MAQQKQGKTIVLLIIICVEYILLNMHRFTTFLIAAAVSGTALFATHQAYADDESDPTTAEAWSAGNTAGVGTFMSYCVTCHGDAGEGDGMLSESLDVRPRNLADPEFMSVITDEHLFNVIKNGGASVGLTENMTPFDGLLSDEEITNVVTYLRKEICKCEFQE